MNLFNNSGADLDETIEETAEETIVENPTNEADDLAEDVEELDSENDSDSENEEDENEDDVYVVDGEEFTLEQLQNAKDIKNMQADYTKKTMALADERKATESERDSLSNLAAELQVLVSEDKEIDWSVLKEEDPDEYIKLKERAESREKKLDKAKSELAKSNEMSDEMIAQEQSLMIEAFPEWVEKDGNGNAVAFTPKYQEDIKAVTAHAKELGFTDQQVSEIKTASIVKALMNSMKFKEKKGKIDIAKKKTKPKQTKPAKSGGSPQPTTLFNKSVK